MKNKILKILCGVLFLVCFACSAISCSCDGGRKNGENNQEPTTQEATKYTFSVSVNNTSYGSVSSNSGGNKFDAGANVTYSIKPAYGKCVLKVVCDGRTKTALDYMNESVDVSGTITLSFSSINSNHSIHVDFGDCVAVESVASTYLGKSDNTRTLSNVAGNVSVFGNNISVPLNTAVKFKVQPATDYVLKEISVNGVDFYSVGALSDAIDGLTYDASSNIILVENVSSDFELHVVFKAVDVKVYLYGQSGGGTTLIRETSVELGSAVYVDDVLQDYQYCYYSTQKNNFEFFLSDVPSPLILDVDGDNFVSIVKNLVISASGDYEVILLFSNNANLGN